MGNKSRVDIAFVQGVDGSKVVLCLMKQSQWETWYLVSREWGTMMEETCVYFEKAMRLARLGDRLRKKERNENEQT